MEREWQNAASKSLSTDLLFIMDVTYSMIPYADELKKQIRYIVSNVERSFNYDITIRMGVVAYTDVTLSPPAVLPLTEMTTEGKAEIEAFLERLIFGSNHQAQDPAEDVHGALEAAGASEIGWRSASRAIVHMADSPGHGTRLHDETAHDDVRQPWYDQLPNYDEHGNLLFKLMKKLFVLRQVQKYCFIHIPIKDPIRFPGEERIFTRTMFKKLQEACGNHGMMAEVEWNNPQEMMLQMGKFLRENIMEWRGGSRLVERIDDPSSGMSDSPDSDSNEASSYATDIVPPENCVVGSGRDVCGA
mmetsp:Transcript_29855/g.88401  ORF Transcript_29855/g.88401 Transcript_29855/m.88401 type:complete len:302 (-) Transcript_29855:310-1215(-)